MQEQVVMLLHRLGNDSPSDVCCYCGGGIIKASASAEEKSPCQSDLYAIQFLEPPWKLRQECDATCRALMQHEVSNVQWPSQHSWQGFRRKWQRTAFQTVFIYNMNDKHPETPSSVLLAFRTLWGTALMPCQTRCACGQEGTKTGLETWTWDFAMTHVTIRILMSVAKRMPGFGVWFVGWAQVNAYPKSDSPQLSDLLGVVTTNFIAFQRPSSCCLGSIHFDKGSLILSPFVRVFVPTKTGLDIGYDNSLKSRTKKESNGRAKSMVWRFTFLQSAVMLAFYIWGLRDECQADMWNLDMPNHHRTNLGAVSKRCSQLSLQKQALSLSFKNWKQVK